MDRALKVHERNGAMLQLLHLFPDLLSLKCQKWSFFIFSTDSKKKSASERSHLENAIGSELTLVKGQPLKVLYF